MAKKEAKSTEVAKVEAPGVPAVQEKQTWGQGGFDPKDILLPRILLTQATSKLVASRAAKPGDLIRSNTKEVLGEKIDFIPLSLFKTWIVEEKPRGAGKYDFRRIEPFTHENAELPWDWADEKTGSVWRRNVTINCYALLPADILREQRAKETGDVDFEAALFPVVLSFSRTSYQVGRDLATKFALAESMGQPLAKTTLVLGVETKTNGQNTWYVPTIGKVGKTPDAYLPAAEHWWGIVTKFAMRVDDAAEDSEPAPQERTVSSEF